jgi:putative nucleotidyltransferase with HDIG domain
MLGLVLRALIVLVPVAVAVAIATVVADVLPRPTSVPSRMGWSLTVLTASTCGLLLVGRFARRLLPLSWLLRVGMAFPDAAPRRFGVALRAVHPGRRERWAGEDPAAALALLSTLLTHDRRTRGHSERVAAYALLIAEELGLDGASREEVRWAGLLHDVGKVAVPPRILNKPGRLDDQEWAVMASHPVEGRALVAPLKGMLGEAIDAVDGHHERWDGSGYPRGVRAADLPLSTRIVAVADAFETMTAARSYKSPVPFGQARTEVTACAGRQFDPAVVRAFLNVSVPRLWRVAGPLALLAQVPVIGSVVQGSMAPGATVAAQGALATAGQVAGTAAIVGGVLVVGGAADPPSTAEERPVVSAEVAEAPLAVHHPSSAAPARASTPAPPAVAEDDLGEVERAEAVDDPVDHGALREPGRPTDGDGDGPTPPRSTGPSTNDAVRPDRPMDPPDGSRPGGDDDRPGPAGDDGGRDEDDDAGHGNDDDRADPDNPGRGHRGGRGEDDGRPGRGEPRVDRN